MKDSCSDLVLGSILVFSLVLHARKRKATQKADFVIANPPFNDSDWSGELLRDDARWKVLGVNLPPPVNGANYAWIQHFLFHFAPTGVVGFVLAKGSLTSKTNHEGEIRKDLIEMTWWIAS